MRRRKYPVDKEHKEEQDKEQDVANNAREYEDASPKSKKEETNGDEDRNGN